MHLLASLASHTLCCEGYGLRDYLLACTVMDIHIFVSHTACINASLFNRSSQNACCSHSSENTHTGYVENILTVCLHALGGGGNVQQLYT